MARFRDKVALVTGAAQGIGRAVAMRLAAEGAKVVLVDRAAGPCELVVREIVAAGGAATALDHDLETREGPYAMVAQTLASHDRIDVAVFNVGGTIYAKPFSEYTDDEIEQEISRSLWPTLRCTRAVIPAMIEQRCGAIVNIGSVATRGIYRVPYSAAKGGVHAMTACLAMELAEFGIRVNCVAPGAVDGGARATPRGRGPATDQERTWRGDVIRQTLRDAPLDRLGTPEEIASAVCYLAADEASYITGETLFVAGGGIG